MIWKLMVKSEHKTQLHGLWSLQPSVFTSVNWYIQFKIMFIIHLGTSYISEQIFPCLVRGAAGQFCNRKY